LNTVLHTGAAIPLSLWLLTGGLDVNIPDAVVVYVAATNLEAHVIADLLQTNDIPAIAVEDQSLVGMWIGGTLPMIHRPKIWVSRKHVQQAHVLIREYEMGVSEMGVSEMRNGGQCANLDRIPSRIPV
jgi:hypothetical protein